MGSGKLLLFSLLLFPLSLLADTAADYAARGAQKYVFGDEDAAKKEVATGLTKFPHDQQLQEMVKLFKDKPPNNQQQNNKNQNQQNKDQQDKDQRNQQQSPNGQGQQNQKQQPSPSPGTTPTPSPTPTPGESSGTSPTPEGESPTPT